VSIPFKLECVDGGLRVTLTFPDRHNHLAVGAVLSTADQIEGWHMPGTLVAHRKTGDRRRVARVEGDVEHAQFWDVGGAGPFDCRDYASPF
jgi:hypothetical protein